MLPEREPFLFLLRAFAILIKANPRGLTGGGISSAPLRRDGDPLKQLAAYHLDIDWPFWSIRKRKNLECSSKRIREIADLKGISMSDWRGFFVTIAWFDGQFI